MLLRRRLVVPDVRHLLAYIVIGVLGVLALVVRVSLYHMETSEYTVFVSQGYDFIQTHGLCGLSLSAHVLYSSGVQLCSLLSYAPYLLNTQVVSLTYMAFIVLVLVMGHYR